jgi:hypothetical protein
MMESSSSIPSTNRARNVFSMWLRCQPLSGLALLTNILVQHIEKKPLSEPFEFYIINLCDKFTRETPCTMYNNLRITNVKQFKSI